MYVCMRVELAPAVQHRLVGYNGVNKKIGARAVLPFCAQLVWCELYVMKDLQKKEVLPTPHDVLRRTPPKTSWEE